MAAIKNRGRAGLAGAAAIVIHSLIPPVSASCLFSHCVALICCSYLFLFFKKKSIPKRHLSVRERTRSLPPPPLPDSTCKWLLFASCSRLRVGEPVVGSWFLRVPSELLFTPAVRRYPFKSRASLSQGCGDRGTGGQTKGLETPLRPLLLWRMR